MTEQYEELKKKFPHLDGLVIDAEGNLQPYKTHPGADPYFAGPDASEQTKAVIGHKNEKARLNAAVRELKKANRLNDDSRYDHLPPHMKKRILDRSRSWKEKALDPVVDERNDRD